jgi:hypothetical protein
MGLTLVMLRSSKLSGSFSIPLRTGLIKDVAKIFLCDSVSNGFASEGPGVDEDDFRDAVDVGAGEAVTSGAA